MSHLLCLAVLIFPVVGASHDKYKHFFPYWSPLLEEAQNGSCLANYTAYLEAPEFNPVACKYLFGCMVGQLPEFVKGDFSSAQVLLGLLPGVLSLASSSVGEISMLSSHRPFLSLLLSMGGPAVYQSRSLEYDYPLKALPRRSSIWTAGKRAQKWWVLVSLCQYIVALLCMANVIFTSWQLGYQTVVVWKCNASYLPLLYSIFPVVIHLVGAGSWYLSNTMKAVRNVGESNKRSNWIRRLRNEYRLCSMREDRSYLEQEQKISPNSDGRVTIMMNQAADIMSFVHMIFGTLTFASSTFIGTLDSVTVIGRYYISTLICRLILVGELGGITYAERQSHSSTQEDELLATEARIKV
jgi:hypothetical protein